MEKHCVLNPFFPTLLLLTSAGEQDTAEVSVGLTQHWHLIYSHLKSVQLGTGMRNWLEKQQCVPAYAASAGCWEDVCV